MTTVRADILVLGSGIGGLLYALKTAGQAKILLITKRLIEDSNTRYAQGGVASVSRPNDSFDQHFADTLNAGQGLCHPTAVRRMVEAGPACIKELQDYGVPFTRQTNAVADDGSPSYDLGREGGHSQRRVFHAGDITGAEIVRALIAHVRRHANITILENHLAVDLITSAKLQQPGANACLGAYVLNRQTGEVLTALAPVTCLATGGAGKAYLYTSNPDVATGDGIAMAYRAGATIANMEFFQFHPTCLYDPRAKSFLISEALRGEGGVLKLAGGATFMERYHPLKSLAPRDVVARAIDFEMKRTGADHVLLDLTHLDPAFLRRRFPNIDQICRSFGIDMTQQPIPVVPAAHYTCGGVAVDRAGLTGLQNLYAIGEVSCTGVHGANRLASNSLLEAAIWAHEAALHTLSTVRQTPPVPEVPSWDPGAAAAPDEMVVVTQNWDEIRRFMWNYVGLVRSDKRLARARRRLDLLSDEIRQYYWDFLITADLLELRNLAVVDELIVACAQHRRESRGLHYNIDCPEKDEVNGRCDTLVCCTPHGMKVSSRPIPES